MRYDSEKVTKYYSAKGTRSGPSQDFSWFLQAAEQGGSRAQYNLGRMYQVGIGVTQDPDQAARWFSKAAAQGDADAQYHLGLMYANGECVTRSSRQAVSWFRQAAEQGHAGAQRRLDLLDAGDEGERQEEKKAPPRSRQAMELGDAQHCSTPRYSSHDGVAVPTRDAQTPPDQSSVERIVQPGRTTPSPKPSFEKTTENPSLGRVIHPTPDVYAPNLNTLVDSLVAVADQFIGTPTMIGYESRARKHIEKLKRINTKLSMFIDAYPGVVRNTHISWSEHHKTDISSGGFTKYYFRDVYSDGSTNFYWFRTRLDAWNYVRHGERPKDGFVKMIGPYRLPFGSGEWFF